MKAYKVFNSDWTCKGYQYEVGKTYTIDQKPELCSIGFHACKKVINCFSYYSFDPKNKIAEVELLGEIVGKDEDKQATNKIKIVRELSWHEVLCMVNTGSGNTGNSNSGHWNSGRWNSGNSHTGYFNSEDAEAHYIFNKLVSQRDKERFHDSEGYRICNRFRLVKYRIRTQTGKYGDYRYLSYKSSWRVFWNNLMFTERKAIRDMPFFDSKIFEVITGVKA